MAKEREPDAKTGRCCFCGQVVSETKVDPCRLTVENSRRLSQTWFCHAACFRRKIIGDPELEPAYF
ncbi:MAG: hypothetical protein WCO26_05765 [Deltaproteobacteria bacterium]